jgi:hypothetical protein
MTEWNGLINRKDLTDQGPGSDRIGWKACQNRLLDKVRAWL